MSIYDQQIAALRRDLNLMKGTQVTIYSAQPRSPNTQAIWRDGATIKIWDGSNWNVMGGGISDFSVDVVFTPVDYNTVSWGSGVINISSSAGTASFAISSGSFDLTTTTYFYWQEDIPTAIQTTTDAATAIQNGGLLVATGFPNADITGKVTLNVFGGKGPSPFIVNADIANGAVNAAKTDLAAISAITGYLNPNTVDTTQIVDNAITSLKVLNGAISTAKIALLAIDSSLIAANAVTSTKILDDSITSPKILAGAVVAGKIAANAVTANEIAAGSITTAKIFAGAVTANELAANSVVAGKIAAGTIVAGDIAAGAITAAKILAGTITAAQIAAGTITAAEIATGTITAAKLVANTITANELNTALVYAGSITLSSGGVVRSGKSTYADTLTGFWLGSDSGTPKFKIGTSTQYMDWSGTAFSIVGGTITGSIVQTSTSGKRIVLESNTFKSYDSSGVLRVQTADEGMRITDYQGTVHADLSTREFSGPGAVIWPYLLVGSTSAPYNRVGVRTSFLAGHPTATDKSLSLYLASGSITFRSIGGGGTSGTGVTLTSPDDDTLTFDGKKISFNGTILEKIGTDLYWNGVKIN